MKMMNTLSQVVALLALPLLLFALASCEREQPCQPCTKKTQEVNPSEMSTASGISIDLEGDLRSSGRTSPLGFKGSGLPVEHSLKAFYNWDEIHTLSYTLPTTFLAQQNFFVKTISYRMVDSDNPSENVAEGKWMIGEVQLLEGSHTIGSVIDLAIPQNLDEDRHYKLVLSLEGDFFWNIQLGGIPRFNGVLHPYDYHLENLVSWHQAVINDFEVARGNARLDVEYLQKVLKEDNKSLRELSDKMKRNPWGWGPDTEAERIQELYQLIKKYHPTFQPTLDAFKAELLNRKNEYMQEWAENKQWRILGNPSYGFVSLHDFYVSAEEFCTLSAVYDAYIKTNRDALQVVPNP